MECWRSKAEVSDIWLTGNVCHKHTHPERVCTADISVKTLTRHGWKSLTVCVPFWNGCRGVFVTPVCLFCVCHRCWRIGEEYHRKTDEVSERHFSLLARTLFWAPDVNAGANVKHKQLHLWDYFYVHGLCKNELTKKKTNILIHGRMYKSDNYTRNLVCCLPRLHCKQSHDKTNVTRVVYIVSLRHSGFLSYTRSCRCVFVQSGPWQQLILCLSDLDLSCNSCTSVSQNSFKSCINHSDGKQLQLYSINNTQTHALWCRTSGQAFSP